VNLFMRTVDTDALVAAIDTMSEAARFNIQHALGERSLFRYMNPTGHYRLDLSKPADRLLTGTLKVRLCSRSGARGTLRTVHSTGHAAGRVRPAALLSCRESSHHTVALHWKRLECGTERRGGSHHRSREGAGA
jgi:hypothetical protein